MKRILLFMLVTSITFSIHTIATCKTSNPEVYEELQSRKNPKGVNKTHDWNGIAEGMSQALLKHFWGANFENYPNRYYFNYESDLTNMTTNHYWPQAHAMDVIVDAYLRTSEKKYLNFYPLWWKGAPEFNFSGKEIDPWWNVYVDDMEWIALAQLRMYETTHREEYFLKAKQIYNDWIWSTWGPENEEPWKGGITWKTDARKSKNACSNGPAAIISARIYTMYDEIVDPGKKPKQSYLDEATKIYTWLRDYLFDSETGKVSDNINAQGRISPAAYTYNQGTFIGAAFELYKISGEKQYMEEAVKAANFVIDSMSTNKGVLRDAPSGDGGLFHGIFFRYFVKIINDPDLDYNTRKKFHDYITLCATVMVENGINKESMLYGGKWWEAPTSTKGVCLTPHLSGCMLMEAMSILKPLNEKRE